MIAVDVSNGALSLLLDLVSLLPLIGLLYAGRANRRRRLVLTAIGAVVATLAWLALGRLANGVRPIRALESAGYVTLALAADVAVMVAGILTIAAWVLLLYAALQARRNGWFFAMAVAVVLTLVVPLVAPLELDGTFYQLLLCLGPVAALICAWLLPTGVANGGGVAERLSV